jgi:hypothetical protein
MATTTNYGWTTPDDTALVKDGASAIRTLGTSVDTTTKNLNPETTLGDLAYRSSTANVKTRLGLGTAGQVLQVNSGANAPEWATFSANSMTSLASGNLSSTSVTLSSISQSYNTLILEIRNMYVNTENGLRIRLNGTSGTSYQRTSVLSSSATNTNATGLSGFNIDGDVPNTSVGMNFSMEIDLYTNATTPKLITYQATDLNNGPTNVMAVGRFASNSAITSITITTAAGTATFNAAGTYVLWGVK